MHCAQCWPLAVKTMCAWGLGELSAQGWNVSKKREVKRKILNEFFFVVLRVGVA